MRAQRKQYIDKKLIRRLRILALIFLILLGIGLYDIALGYLPVLLALAALVGGVGLGLLVGRAFNVVWHEETSKAISRIDLFGGVILGAYILFALFRRWLFEHWLHGHQLSAFVICFSSGIMLGRLITLRSRIIRVLKQNDVYFFDR